MKGRIAVLFILLVAFLFVGCAENKNSDLYFEKVVEATVIGKSNQFYSYLTLEYNSYVEALRVHPDMYKTYNIGDRLNVCIVGYKNPNGTVQSFRMSLDCGSLVVENKQE